jgi:hypothetical protein
LVRKMKDSVIGPGITLPRAPVDTEIEISTLSRVQAKEAEPLVDPEQQILERKAQYLKRIENYKLWESSYGYLRPRFARARAVHAWLHTLTLETLNGVGGLLYTRRILNEMPLKLYLEIEKPPQETQYLKDVFDSSAFVTLESISQDESLQIINLKKFKNTLIQIMKDLESFRLVRGVSSEDHAEVLEIEENRSALLLCYQIPTDLPYVNFTEEFAVVQKTIPIIDSTTISSYWDDLEMIFLDRDSTFHKKYSSLTYRRNWKASILMDQEQRAGLLLHVSGVDTPLANEALLLVLAARYDLELDDVKRFFESYIQRWKSTQELKQLRDHSAKMNKMKKASAQGALQGVLAERKSLLAAGLDLGPAIGPKKLTRKSQGINQNNNSDDSSNENGKLKTPFHRRRLRIDWTVEDLEILSYGTAILLFYKIAGKIQVRLSPQLVPHYNLSTDRVRRRINIMRSVPTMAKKISNIGLLWQPFLDWAAATDFWCANLTQEIMETRLLDVTKDFRKYCETHK